jgi:hypothetical protein
MAGIPFAATDINMKAGALVVGVWRALDEARDFYLWLNDPTHTDSALVAAGMQQSDVTLIKNSFGDLGGPAGLWAVSHATFTPSGASNYFANAKQLTGVNYTG